PTQKRASANRQEASRQPVAATHQLRQPAAGRPKGPTRQAPPPRRGPLPLRPGSPPVGAAPRTRRPPFPALSLAGRGEKELTPPSSPRRRATVPFSAKVSRVSFT